MPPSPPSLLLRTSFLHILAEVETILVDTVARVYNAVLAYADAVDLIRHNSTRKDELNRNNTASSVYDLILAGVNKHIVQQYSVMSNAVTHATLKVFSEGTASHAILQITSCNQSAVDVYINSIEAVAVIDFATALTGNACIGVWN